MDLLHGLKPATIFLFGIMLASCHGGDLAQCEESVKEHLKSPATAKFSSEKFLAGEEVTKYLSQEADELASLLHKVYSMNQDAATSKLAFETQMMKNAIDASLEEQKKAPFPIVTFAVDSQNGFGAIVRSAGRCEMRATGIKVEMSQR
ncbi:MAG TPA: hypothetical protein VIE67_01620 [Rudaea sp.]|uniref:hypothetical protein n=1 Tax=Rudaea sp. TaxID=2136325 RepID=UPI002F91E4AD